jgi:hypothetical protein
MQACCLSHLLLRLSLCLLSPAYGQNARFGGEEGCGDPLSGDCCDASYTPYCADAECCESVCSYMPYCCGEEGWDDFCAQAAWEDMNCHCGAQIGACCNPMTGACADDISSTDCSRPLQFTAGATCESLDPPCGNPGACCYDGEGTCQDGVFEPFCEGTRFLGGGSCEDFDPPCGSVEPIEILFLETPTDPPPPVQCGCEMTPFAEDPRPEYETIDTVPSPCPFAGEIQFSVPMWHLRVPDSWMTWSHGYTSDVYQISAFSDEVTLTLPPGTCAFYFYVQPSEWQPCDFRVTVNETTTTPPFTADGYGGATYVGVCCPNIETIRIVCLCGDSFAVGEFGICCACAPIYGACCDHQTGICTDDIAAADCQSPLQFIYDTPCETLDPPCGNPGACCDPFTGECQDAVPELVCRDNFRFEPGMSCEGLDPPCGTPGCCCVDSEGTLSVELEAVCLSQGGRFIAGLGPDECTAEAFTPPCGMWQCSGILYAPTRGDTPAWRLAVARLAGCRVDYWDARQSTPTLQVLRDYCMVFTWVDFPYADNVAMGDVLADYVDTGGRVVLGQWTYETFQGFYLAGRIMTPAYCPITAEIYNPGLYAGDGTDCAWCGVESLESDFVDYCTPLPGAEFSGTFTTGEPALIWRADRRVYYSPGNTGPFYMPGDTARLIANIYNCDGASSAGACCDPYTALCTDEVECDACFLPSEFFVNRTCGELNPPCGNPGCCCDDSSGSASIEFEANCTGRFLSGWPEEECTPEAFEPSCGEYQTCTHTITMWDDFGDGWGKGFIDVFLNGVPVLTGITLDRGSGPESVTFEAATGDLITTMWTPGAYANESSYCIYDGLDGELGCDGLDGAEPRGISVAAACEPAVCGDGICAASENCCTCPQDCGDAECLNQPPDQFVGLVSDLDAVAQEGRMAIVAENFSICPEEMKEIDAVRFWGGYAPGDVSTDPDAFTVAFYMDSGRDTPGAALASYGVMPATSKTTTGLTFVGVSEYEYTVDLEPNLMLEGGDYWLAIYNFTTESADSWLWETGAPDQCAGMYGAAVATELPENWLPLDPPRDLAVELICVQASLPGDLNCDGLVNAYDIDPFVLALISAPSFTDYYALYPDCDGMLADINCDRTVNGYDIDPFVHCLTEGRCPPCQ